MGFVPAMSSEAAIVHFRSAIVFTIALRVVWLTTVGLTVALLTLGSRACADANSASHGQSASVSASNSVFRPFIAVLLSWWSCTAFSSGIHRDRAGSGRTGKTA